MRSGRFLIYGNRGAFDLLYTASPATISGGGRRTVGAARCDSYCGCEGTASLGNGRTRGFSGIRRRSLRTGGTGIEVAGVGRDRVGLVEEERENDAAHHFGLFELDIVAGTRNVEDFQ